MDRDWQAEHWSREPTAPAPEVTADGEQTSVGRQLLDRAEAAVRRAGDLTVEWFWLRQALLGQSAERLSAAAERQALAAHRTGRLWPDPRTGFLAQWGRRRRAPPREPG